MESLPPPSPLPAPTTGAAIATGNAFGLTEALLGVVAGFVFSAIGVGIYEAAKHHVVSADSLAGEVIGLFGLWIGLFGAAVFASRADVLREGDTPSVRRFVGDFGVALRPWPDLLLGLGVGVGAQYLLVPLFELPLLPFVPHLFNRLSAPAKNLTGGVHGAGLVLLGVLICLGSPLVEEVFFRGLLLRGLIGRTAMWRQPLGLAVSIVSAGVVFGLLHFEALQLISLVGFGVVLGMLATKTRRLGPGFVAHVAFNATTFIALALGH